MLRTALFIPCFIHPTLRFFRTPPRFASQQNAGHYPHDTRSDRQGRDRSRSPPRKRGRSKSPSRRRQSPTAPKAKYDKPTSQRGQSFRNGASRKDLAACAICLGRQPHRVRDCNAEKTWDGARARCRRNDARIINPSGLTLCCDWQREDGCRSSSHDERHECSGCGATDHGAQRCKRAQPVAN